MSEQKKVGWAFPLGVDAMSGKILTTDEREDIRQALFVLLSTEKGERILNPSYGCNLQQFAFETVTYALLSQMEKEITTAIRNHEPRVGNLDVVFHKADGQTDESSEKLVAEIRYTIRETEESDSISYPIVINA